ncbi:MAG: hypothetical protein QM564_07650 [Bergeyella sp.]
MKNKWIRSVLMFTGTLFLMILLANFGVNFWLKKKLPDYLRQNTDYIINYKNLDVDLGTGNIFASGVSVNPKNPDNRSVLNIQGTADSLKIGRLGVVGLLFSKKISTSDLELANPQLNIILPKPKSEKEKKNNPFSVQNIRIRNGNISIYKENMSKLLSVSRLNLKVKNLKMKELPEENILPITFDEYSIDGEKLFFRTAHVYTITAQKLNTEKGNLSITDCKLIPLLSQAQYLHFFPEKGNLFAFSSKKLTLENIQLKNNDISLSKIRLESPDFKIFTAEKKPKNSAEKTENSFAVEHLLLNNANIEIIKPDGTSLFQVSNLNAGISGLKNNSVKGGLPVSFEKFDVKGNNIRFGTATQKITAGAISLNEKSGDFRNIIVKPTVSASPKTLLDFTAKQFSFQADDWKYENKKLKLAIRNFLIDGLNGTVRASKNPHGKKPDFSGIEFPLPVKNITLKNSNITFEKGSRPLTFYDLNARFQNVEMNAETVKNGIPFKIENYSLSTRNFKYITKFYELSGGFLKVNNNALQTDNFALKPRYTRSRFVRMITAERDLYNISVNRISLNGKWDFLSQQKFMEASQLTISGLDANIFRSKIPPDDPKTKPLYSALLRGIKFPLYIENTDIKNSRLVYEEDTKKSDGPGKLEFGNFNLNAKHLNSGKMKGKPTRIPVSIDCRFFNVSPMHVDWNMNTANLSDAFAISGKISSLPAASVNAFAEPYLKIRTSGRIENLKFDFHGDKNKLDGKFHMNHRDLKIAVLKNGEKDKFISAVANIFVRSSNKNRENVIVDDVMRDPAKSFFNLFWKGIEEGLKKTLIGSNVEKTEQSVRNTVDGVKTAKEDAKTTVSEVKSAVKETLEKKKMNKEKEQRNPFKRKERAE